ncbi:MAG: alpha/beta fold hydrolase [Sphingomicrobium sp.]
MPRYAMPQVKTATGIAIGYDEAGEGGHAPVVFLHGVGSDKSVWRPQLEHFGADRRAVAFDYPGYGESDSAPEGTSRDDYAAVILAAMTALGIDRAHVCGLSLGGVVAIAMFHAWPGRVTSLILADTFAEHPDGRAIYERSLAGSADMRVLAESRVDVLLAQPANPAVRSEVIETMARIDPDAYRIGAEAVWLADQRERVHEIRVPTLVLCGAEDRITPPVLSAALTKLIPGAQYDTVERAGHLSNLEQPHAFNTLVSAFIRGVDSRS